MYEAHYGLKSKPFQLTPDPSFYFGSKQHSRARSYLDYGVSKHEGFIVITGEVGAGKTTVVRGLIDGLAGSNMVIGNIVTTQLDADDTLKMVGAAFGIQVANLAKAELLLSLEAFLLGQAVQGKRALLIVDEAQNLTSRAVEELRMLSNFQYGTRSLLQSFLVGQPEFRQILQRPEMEQFRQRVTAACHIGALEEAETRGYIEHRLQCAGATDRPTFEAEAFAAIHEATGGVPRRINALCDRLLLRGLLSDRTHLTNGDVVEVVSELSLESHMWSPPVGSNEGSFRFTQASSAFEGTDGDHSLRLESRLRRLEHLSVEVLSMLQRLLNALNRPG